MSPRSPSFIFIRGEPHSLNPDDIVNVWDGTQRDRSRMGPQGQGIHHRLIRLVGDRWIKTRQVGDGLPTEGVFLNTQEAVRWFGDFNISCPPELLTTLLTLQIRPDAQAGPNAEPEQSAQPTLEAPLPVRRPGPDYRDVLWHGANHKFTATQAAVVKVLWEAYTNETPDVGQETLLEKAGSDAKRLSDLFKGHAAWDTMIVEGTTRGTRRLAPQQ